jgi:hypothetical protein
VHRDAELHNLIVCPAPLELLIIDFENATDRDSLEESKWDSSRKADLTLILREAIFLQCALGQQTGPLATTAWQEMDSLFKAPERFRREIRRQAEI